MSNRFLQHAQVKYPLICGAMYPCSNPELVAAASEAGGLGVIQPISLSYVHGFKLREGIKRIRELTDQALGFNLLVEGSSRVYRKRMEAYLEIALEEGIRFFVTALGKPSWVIREVHRHGGVVYHDVTERKYAKKVVDAGVDGLICVNSRAGGHLGARSAEELYSELQDLGVPLVCAGGVGSKQDYREALQLGYEAVQMGTRFIATRECNASEEYKQAIVRATEQDIVSTVKVTGVPLSVIENEYVTRRGTNANPFMRYLLRQKYTKHWVRMFYSLISMVKLRRSNFRSDSTRHYWQAGKSVEGIHSIESVRAIIENFNQNETAQQD